MSANRCGAVAFVSAPSRRWSGVNVSGRWEVFFTLRLIPNIKSIYSGKKCEPVGFLYGVLPSWPPSLRSHCYGMDYIAFIFIHMASGFLHSGLGRFHT